MELIKAALYGVVEGITEWLPVSSTGHIILLGEFLPLDVSPKFMELFLVVIQLGAILAVVTLFWGQLFPFSFGERPAIRKDIFVMWFKVAVACIPAVVFSKFLIPAPAALNFASACVTAFCKPLISFCAVDAPLALICTVNSRIVSDNGCHLTKRISAESHR
jgi:undecaprenyl pyrophosphate phosphatase UppP